MAESEQYKVIIPYPASPQLIVPATKFRGTWLSSSIQALKRRSMFDEYLSKLPKQYHEAITQSVPGAWYPAHIAVVHYETCDQLGFTPAEQVSIGEEVTLKAQGTVLNTIFRLATKAGVSPWIWLKSADRLWANTWVGGSIGITQLGAQKAKLQVGGWPCSRVPYCRNALRGLLQATAKLFARQALAQDIPELCTDQSLGYTLSWS